MMSRDYEGVSPSRKQQLVREFKKIDVNGNGVIDNHEAVEWMVQREMRDAADGVGDKSNTRASGAAEWAGARVAMH